MVKKTVEDVKAVQYDHLGKVKNLGQGLHPSITDGQCFGAPSMKDSSEWNAAKCLRGEPSAKELMPDMDLGRCTKPGSRNQVRAAMDSERAFGIPSIRTDIPNKEFKSVANHQNYGDEPEAVDILFPATNLEMGVTEADFMRARPKADIRTLFERIGYAYKPGKFNAIFNRSVQISSEQLGKPLKEQHTTVRGMMAAVQEMHDLQ